MPIEFPKNRKEITDRIKNDVRAELGPKSNPFLRNSALGSLIFGMAGRIFDFFSQLKFLLINLFPDTATGSFLERWGSYVKIGRLAASTATGKISINGEVLIPTPHIIPVGTEFESSSQFKYSSLGKAIVIDVSSSVAQITRAGETATVKTKQPHPFSAGLEITIIGADQVEYNGTFIVTSVSEFDVFTYEIVGAPPPVASGTIFATSKMAEVTIQSVEFSSATNLDGGESVSLVTPISGVNNQGFTQFAGITDGSNEEEDDEFRARILDRYQNPVSFFNVAQIEQKVKTLHDVTRVFVQGPESDIPIPPPPGQVIIFFVNDNLPTIIPPLSQVREAKLKVFEIKPAHVFGGKVDEPNFDPTDGDIIFPPLFVTHVDFIFLSLKPDSPSMRDAIKRNLEQFFRGENNVNEDISEATYTCVIQDSFDDARQTIKEFSLQTPNGPIVIGQSGIATLGNIIFQF